MGANAFTNIVIREDDGTTGSVVPAAAVGAQGDVCEEQELALTTGSLDIAPKTIAPGEAFTATATGYRVGESVSFALNGAAAGAAIADATGTATITVTAPVDTILGTATVTTTGAGFGYKTEGTLNVLATTTTALAISPETPALLEAVTLTATVSGASTAGSVTFTDGETVLGSADTVDGVATLTIDDGFGAREHELVATFGATSTASASASDSIGFTLAKNVATIVVTTDASTTVYGDPIEVTATVDGADAGTVRFSYGDAPTDVVAEDGTAALSLPADLLPGEYTVTAQLLEDATTEASTVASASFTITKLATSVEVSMNAASRVFGMAGVVTAELDGVETGVVRFGYGTATVDVEATDGVAELTLPATLAGGSYAISAQLLGSSTSEASAIATTPYEVRKKATTTGLSLSRTKLGRNSADTATITIGGAVAGTYPTGNATLRYGGKTKTVTLTSADKGKVSVRFIPGTTVKTVSVYVTYAGTGDYAASKSKTIKVTVVK